jgi:hypothetical protein
METIPETVTTPDKPAVDLPLDVAAVLLGTKWETPLTELQPR